MDGRRLVIFAGAGASRGVSGEKYPTTVEFFKKLPSGIKDDGLFKSLIQFFDAKNAGQAIDIELVLWELKQLSDVFSQFDGDNFAAHLLRSGDIRSITGHQSDPGATYGQFSQFRMGSLSRLIDSINAQVYDLYSGIPEPQELMDSWEPLLRWVGERGFAACDLVTTNYDLVIEHALESHQQLRISTGVRRRGNLQDLDLDEWKNPTEGFGRLTKLHGSIDWRHARNATPDRPSIRVGALEFEGNHDSRLIIYPGFKGAPSGEPFITFHEYFRERLRRATDALFIGFAFRDPYINEIIASSLPSGANVAIVSPEATASNFPVKGTNIRPLPRRFGTVPRGLLSSSASAFDGGPPGLTVDDLESWASGSSPSR